MPQNQLKIFPVTVLPFRNGRAGEGGRRLCPESGPGRRSRPWLSVVTICLNCRDELESTMASVLRWPSSEVEYIIIDGGSSDGSVELLQQYDSQLEYWVSEPDQGISDAFNKGISLCRGDVVGLLNAGDWYAPDALAAVRKDFAAHRESGVVCGRMQFWQGGEKAYCTDSEPALLRRDMSVAHPACFVRTTVYHALGGFDADFRLAMDYELLLRFFVHGVGFVKNSTVLTNMRHDGISEEQWRMALEETHKARKRYLPGSLYASRTYLSWLVVRRYLRFALQKLGMNGLIRFYREHLAAVTKVRPQ